MQLAHRRLLIAFLTLQLAAPMMPAQTAEAALVAKAKGLHDRVLKLDTHNDIDPSNFTADCNYLKRLNTQVNLPKMVQGDMDVAFLIVYVGQGLPTEEGYEDAYNQAIEKFDAIHRFTEKIAPDVIGLALTPEDVRRLHKQGKRVAVIGVENGYPIGTDIKRVKEFYDRGGRYMSLAHNGNSQLADSNTGEATGYLHNNGLSPLGRQVIAEMNRLGMMVDLSHPSKGANLEAIRLSKAPVIASHSSVRALADHSRNMDDEQLLALKKNGGVIQIVGFASYVKVDSKERTEALSKMRTEMGFGGGGGRPGAAAGFRRPTAPRPCSVEDPKPADASAAPRRASFLNMLPPDKRAEYEKRMAEIDAKYPAVTRATVKDMVDHLDYAVKKIGIDHVGISSDFDGGGGIDGWDSAAEAFNVTLEMVRRGYTEEQIGKIWSGNLLRVWGEVDKVAAKLQKK
ncbi:MAG: membrane dipeptidase [Acidobacteria bacterium]|nr:membrane dipeptidase [Acidobacteriota bacterium]